MPNNLVDFVDNNIGKRIPSWALQSTLDRCPPFLKFEAFLKTQGVIHHPSNSESAARIVIHIQERALTPLARSALAHEWFHHVARGISPHLPLWVSEGLATWFDFQVNQDPNLFQEGLEQNATGLMDFSDSKKLSFSYSRAGLFFSYLADRFGPNQIWELLKRFSNPNSDAECLLDQYFSLTAGKSFLELVVDFETQRLNHTYNTPILRSLRFLKGPTRFDDWGPQSKTKERYRVFSLTEDQCEFLKKNPRIIIWKNEPFIKTNVSAKDKLRCRDEKVLGMFY